MKIAMLGKKMEKKTPNRIWIIDSTLRDGEQAPDILFNRKDRLILAKKLIAAGIDELEAGIPSRSEEDRKSIREITGLNPNVRITSWCQPDQKDIEMAALCQSHSVHIGFPVSPRFLNILNQNESWVLQQMEKLVPWAYRYFDYVSVGAQDATQADPLFLEQFVTLAASCGAYKVRIADTYGVATPSSTEKIVRRLKGPVCDMMIEFHGHNDMNLAVINTLSALKAGARAVSATINGVGRGAGNADLISIAEITKSEKTFSNGLDLSKLKAIRKWVTKIARWPLSIEKTAPSLPSTQNRKNVFVDAVFENRAFSQYHLPSA